MSAVMPQYLRIPLTAITKIGESEQNRGIILVPRGILYYFQDMADAQT
jgi:hypothetical protein